MKKGDYGQNMTFARCWAIIEYLRRNTDEGHATRFKLLAESEELKEYLKDDGTFRNTVFNIASSLNCDEFGILKPEDKWLIMYDAYREKYGDNAEDDDDELLIDAPISEGDKKKYNKKYLSVKHLYYKHPFSSDEVNNMIEAILFSRLFDTNSANALIKKIRENLTSKYNNKIPLGIRVIKDDNEEDKDNIIRNLNILREAIDKRAAVEFWFNGYDKNKNLYRLRDKKDVVVPYYIVADRGRYYLLACYTSKSETARQPKMYIFRIDLMRDVEIVKNHEKRIPDKGMILGMPADLNAAFIHEHLNMGFDKPEYIKFKLRNAPDTANNHTFLRDTFGDDYTVIKKSNDGEDVIRVKCSPYAIANWAFEYANRVEILEPESVRQKVIEKIKDIMELYGVNSEV